MGCSCLETAYPRHVGSDCGQRELELVSGFNAAAHGRCTLAFGTVGGLHVHGWDTLTFGTIGGLHGWGRCGFFSGTYQLRC